MFRACGFRILGSGNRGLGLRGSGTFSLGLRVWDNDFGFAVQSVELPK